MIFGCFHDVKKVEMKEVLRCSHLVPPRLHPFSCLQSETRRRKQHGQATIADCFHVELKEAIHSCHPVWFQNHSFWRSALLPFPFTPCLPSPPCRRAATPFSTTKGRNEQHICNLQAWTGMYWFPSPAHRAPCEFLVWKERETLRSVTQ